MNNFTLHTPTRILFGRGQVAHLRHEIPPGSKILITYGGGSIKKNGILDQIMNELPGVTISTFGGIEPNPAYETLLKAVEQVKAEQADFLLAAGGGSVIDGTKFIAAAACYDGDPWQIMADRGAGIQRALPLGVVLTLPATGSETNTMAVITRRSTQDKQAFSSAHCQPRFAILDPVYTYTLPPRQTGNGVVDAFVHTIEQYLTWPVDAKVQDRFAEGLLQTLKEEGPKALQEPENYAVRANIMWSATLALNGLIGAGVPQDWATHRLGHELTALYGLDHAQTLAVILPTLLDIKREQKRQKLLQYADRVWGIDSGDAESRIDKAIAATRAFFEKMGLPTHLRDYQLSSKDIPPLLVKLAEKNLTALGEHQDITPEVCRKIYQQAL